MKYNKDAQKRLQELTNAFLEKENPVDIQEDMVLLVDVLNFHEYRYAVLNDPIIGDSQYDQLYDKLRSAEARRPSWILDNSPSQRVTSDLTTNLDTVRHYSPMLSLDNSYNKTDIEEFQKRAQKLLGEVPMEFVVEPKLDGGTVVLIYEDDRLISAATRGNGKEGEDITSNVKTISSVPLHAPFSRFGYTKAEIRGEAVMSKMELEAQNKKRKDAGLSEFANTRNAATGGLRMKDPKDAAQRNLTFFAFQISYFEGTVRPEKHSEQLTTLESVGFKVAQEATAIVSDVNTLMEAISAWDRQRTNFPFDTDGLVIKINDLGQQEILGETAHHPRWAIAYKFPAQQATTTLEDIDFQVGKTGAITPVAKVKPVHLSGVTISSISLHNADFIEEKDLRIGDHVVIERAGEVIPYIVRSLPELRADHTTPFIFPVQCPIGEKQGTSQPLIRQSNTSAWLCGTCDCGAQMYQKLVFHASKAGMDIDGLGPSQIRTFIDNGWVSTIPDLYRLDYEQIAELSGFGTKSAENLKKSVEKAKGNDINILLQSLSIHHLGPRAAQIISKEVDHLFDLFEWDEEDFTALKDIGPVLARNMVDYLKDDENKNMLLELQKLGINMASLSKNLAPSAGVLSGLNVLFTGTLVEMKRNEAKKLAEQNGATVVSGVSKNLNVLVVGEKAGSKLKKAQAIPSIEIWTEEEFLKKIKTS